MTSTELPQYGEVGITTTSYPVNQQMALPNSETGVDIYDIDASVSDNSVQKLIEGPDNNSHYQQIDVDVHSSPSDKPAHHASKSSKPGSTKHKLPAGVGPNELPLRHDMSSRQCKFEIGEEWEQFHARHTKTSSCPPSPLGSRKQSDANIYNIENPGYAASEPGADTDQDLTDAADQSKEPFPFHLFFKSPSATKDDKIDKNPYNNVNHRCHSTLHCPCFLFFFFICCLPGVHMMQRSDLLYKSRDRKKARKMARAATVMYIVGTILGIAFLAVAIYFAAGYVRKYI